jgi:hypothetical protein
MSDRRRVADDELFAHLVTFSSHQRRRPFDEDQPKPIVLDQRGGWLRRESPGYVNFVAMQEAASQDLRNIRLWVERGVICVGSFREQHPKEASMASGAGSRRMVGWGGVSGYCAGPLRGRRGSENKPNMLLVGAMRPRPLGSDEDHDDDLWFRPSRRNCLRRQRVRECRERRRNFKGLRPPWREPVAGGCVGHLPISSAG